MNKAVKEEIRETLALLKLGELRVSESLEDICEIVDEYNKKLREQRKRNEPKRPRAIS